MPAPAIKPFTIHEIKQDILRRARERQASIERGDYDVPIHYTPLPLATVLDLISQLDYRCDFLDLAVPPPGRSLLGRLKRFCKSSICKSLRWLLIRQVEFNLIAVEQARASAELVAGADRSLGEFMAALTAMKLQITTLRQRVACLEGNTTAVTSAVFDAPISACRFAGTARAKQPSPSVYLECLQGHAPVFLLGCGHGDFLRTLVSEGIPARGVEADPALAEYCRERELPVVCADIAGYVDRLADDSVGAIYLGSILAGITSREVAALLGRCWAKIKKGGLIIAETSNPMCSEASADSPSYWAHGAQVPAELLSYLVESQCFTVVDFVFRGPVDAGAGEWAQTGVGLPFDRKRYRAYAIIGRK
jgi:hypothetical protein